MVGLILDPFFCLEASAASQLVTKNKFALVIANQQYDGNELLLKMPYRDADRIASALKAANFDVTPHKDLTKTELVDAIEIFARKLKEHGEDAIGFFYYAGHGLSHPKTKKNFLLMSDTVASEHQIKFKRQLAVEKLVEILEKKAGKASKYIVVDACRNVGTRGFLGLMGDKYNGFNKPPIGKRTIQFFSTSDGNFAADDGGFAFILADYLKNKKLSGIVDALREAHKTFQERRSSQKSVLVGIGEIMPREIIHEREITKVALVISVDEDQQDWRGLVGNEIEGALQDKGFEVKRLVNPSINKMYRGFHWLKERLRNLKELANAKNSRTSDIMAFVYYSGAGGAGENPIRVKAQNYIFPSSIQKPSFDEAISFQRLYDIDGGKSEIPFVAVIDACSKNTIERNGLKNFKGGYGRGALERKLVDRNFLLVLACSPYTMGGEDSTFSKGLAKRLKDPLGIRIRSLFEELRAYTFKKTKGRQLPQSFGNLAEHHEF